MRKHKTILSLMLCLLLVGVSFAAETGPLAPSAFPKVGNAGPLGISKMFVLEAPVMNGKAQIILPIDTPRNAIAVVLGETSVRVLTKDQMALEPVQIREKEMTRMNLPSDNTRFNLDRLPAGIQTLYLHDLKNSKFVKMVVAQPETPLSLVVQVTPLAARTGDIVTITARINDTDAPRTVSIQAALANLPVLSLNDSGLNGDAQADDGLYSVSFTAPAVNGFKGCNIRFSAEGKRANGNNFSRNAISSVMVAEPRSNMLKTKISVADEAVTIPIRAAKGNYRLEAIFGVNGTTLAYSREDVLLNSGNIDVSLPLPHQALAADSAIIRLLNKDTLGLEDEVKITLTPRQAPPDFETLKKDVPPLPFSKARAAAAIQDQD